MPQRIILTTSALYNRAKRSSCAIFPYNENQFPCVIPASLCLLFLPRLPWLPHWNNRPRSHPAHSASTAPCQPIHHLSRTKAEVRPYPATVRLPGCGLRPTSSKDAVKKQMKSGNFNWLHRQF